MKRGILIVIAVAAAFVAGHGYGRWYGKGAAPNAKPGERKILYWHDPMHPWYRSDKPGTAPDCGMALTPVYEGEESKGAAATPDLPPGAVRVSPEKQQFMGVEFGAVEYTPAETSVRAVAKVALDETRIAKVSAKIDGWIDEVFVNFTGKLVEKGQPLLTIYSPEALATQTEYLLALKAKHQMTGNMVHELETSTDNLYAAARKRLELWDISDQQIDAITKTGKPLKNLTLYAPIGGFVMERNAFAKQRITADTVLYTLADLSSVWVLADVFEYEAANVKVGQPAALTLSYMPGRTFHGRVSYILPQVDPNTRTLKVRIQFDNPGFALKPEMYGDVELRTGGGRKLTVPRQAVLDSGLKQVVFLDGGNGTFEPREVKTGEQIGDRVEILGGLKAGERIVTSGNFLIDSESQLKSAMEQNNDQPHH